MWNTPSGDRTLVGEEAKLIRDLVWHVRDMIVISIDINEAYQSDVYLFNALQPTQQIAVLHEVCSALLSDEIPPPELTAIREATVHVLFRELLGMIEIELDMERLDEERDVSVRSRVLLIDAERRKRTFWNDDNLRTISVDCRDIIVWNDLVECLADEILWDRDFEMEALLVDAAPDKANMMKQILGIEHEYFCSVAPDANSQAEFKRLDQQLLELLN